MADEERVVDEPDVGFDGDGAVGERGVKGRCAPVVVVAVYGFLRGVKRRCWMGEEGGIRGGYRA